MADSIGGLTVVTSSAEFRHLRENPGIGGSGAANHHGIAIGFGHDARSILRRLDVAIANHRYFHGLLYRGDDLPVGTAGIALDARTRMDGYRFDAQRLRQPGHFHRNDGLVVPAGAQLDG